MTAEVTRGVILTILCSALYGIYPATSQKAYALGCSVSFLIVVSTFARALGVTFWAWSRGQRVFQQHGQLSPTILGGLLQAASTFGILASLEYISGPVMITIVFAHPTMLLLLSAALGKLQLTRVAVITTLCALLGIALVVDIFFQTTELSIIGVALAFGAAIGTTFRVYIFGQQVTEIPPNVVAAQTFWVALLALLPLLYLMPAAAPDSLQGYLWVTLCSASLALASVMAFNAIKLLGAFRFSLLAKLEPIFTAIFSILIVNEVLTAWQYLGMALVLGSLFLYAYCSRPRKGLEQSFGSFEKA